MFPSLYIANYSHKSNLIVTHHGTECHHHTAITLPTSHISNHILYHTSYITYHVSHITHFTFITHDARSNHSIYYSPYGGSWWLIRAVCYSPGRGAPCKTLDQIVNIRGNTQHPLLLSAIGKMRSMFNLVSKYSRLVKKYQEEISDLVRLFKTGPGPMIVILSQNIDNDVFLEYFR